MNSPDPASRLNAAFEGRYRIEREIGEGGMATVYLADDLSVGHAGTGDMITVCSVAWRRSESDALEGGLIWQTTDT